MSGDTPMPPERFHQLVQARSLEPRPDLLMDVDPREISDETSPLAAELLGEAAARPLESGELLLICEETTLADLEAAAAVVTLAAPLADPDEEPALAALAAPRLFSPRLDDLMDWRPALAEVLRLLEGALQAGAAVPLTMLVGHVETYPEWVEHLMRVRHLRDNGRGRVGLTVSLASDDDLTVPDERVVGVARAARPTDVDLMRRHAQALAVLALGSDSVVGS